MTESVDLETLMRWLADSGYGLSEFQLAAS
jgi:hypothetical protein